MAANDGRCPARYNEISEALGGRQGSPGSCCRCRKATIGCFPAS